MLRAAFLRSGLRLPSVLFPEHQDVTSHSVIPISLWLPPSCRSLSRISRIPPRDACRSHLRLLFLRYPLAAILDLYANLIVRGSNAWSALASTIGLQHDLPNDLATSKPIG